MIKATLAVAAVLALAACGGSDEQPAAPAETAPPAATVTEAETEPATTEAATAETETEPAETETQPANTEPESNALVVRVRNGEPVGGVQKIEVRSGDRVRFVVRADAPEEVHVHGYDISKDVGPGQNARFNFVADLEGVFEIELENSSVQIIELAVEP